MTNVVESERAGELHPLDLLTQFHPAKHTKEVESGECVQAL